jgi:signal transduction histidine kinase
VRCAVPGGIAILGDGCGAAEVVLVLLDNARRHAPGSPIEVRARELCTKVALYVEDRGNGVSEELRDRLFERGVCRGDTTGSGLGLYVARRIMREQGGAIFVRSRPGGGTTFVLHFPRPDWSPCAPHRGVQLSCSRYR